MDAKLLATALATLVASCSSSTEPFVENLDIAICDPVTATFSITINNPFFPVVPGTKSVLLGNDDGMPVRLEMTVFDSTVVIAGVTTRILEEREWHDTSLAEVSRNFFAQESGGAVCYFGEDVDEYAGGVIVGHSSEWRAGVAGASPGIFMPASPAVGMAFRQEVAPGVAEDRIQIKAKGEAMTVPAGVYTNTLRFFETTPLEPGATSTKVYAASVGTILDDVLQLTSRTP